MKLSQITFAVATLVASSVTFAGSLSSSKMISFLALDGHKVTSKTVMQINDTNTHQVVVEVGGMVKSGSNSSYFETHPIVLTFKGSLEDIKISAPRISTDFQAKRFKKSPKFNIETASGEKLAYKIDYLKGEGFMPYARIQDNLAEYNATDGVAAVASFATTQSMPMAVQNIKTKKGKVVVSGQNVAEQQLQYWFQQADKATQQRFLKWAKKQ
ncbi:MULTISPECIES: curli polymerization inhibitor CsgI-related protein [Pasteurellaceae]|uniref:DUF2057 domain-containing protein n=3 Tax=Pasteurellaceae TaxID=712 RepID=A0ACC6HMF2_9PAST|nr:DUF2057 domain-containing protein [Pasteurella atlantica]MBR0573886.1 DUF2057 domain-containing protein [Pasteurella atlantica]MDP8039879.1 DUF2057 domain-containing protein [Pasteurella atlantica]MDP8041961.1 DUF2057 domain-containing protein [Pasteurella atlantica]MDP8044110.1 DUF2057 domain-containing protein [Pasteurella atlantica]MDP8046160.1 DUF2057 domain-containing protein [Pasteurella atlantica]